MLDLGTDNEKLLADPYYLGVRQQRLKGEAYYEAIEECMQAIRQRFPNALVQFEDFSSDKASKILNMFRHDSLVFNDDIQGTGATLLSGVLSALRVRGMRNDGTAEPLGSQRIMVCGGGSAGLGIVQVLFQAMVSRGLSPEEAKANLVVVDQWGIMGSDHPDRPPLTEEQSLFASTETSTSSKLDELVSSVKPTVLIGATACPGLFSQQVVEAMASANDDPIIFPLSNPTSSSECTAREAYEWTDGKVIFASGSPFPQFKHSGQTVRPSQANNMYIFPGLGLGGTLCQASVMTDEMILTAAEALAECLTPEEAMGGQVFPSVNRIRECSQHIACAVIKKADEQGIAQAPNMEEILEQPEHYVKLSMFEPKYTPIVPGRHSMSLPSSMDMA